MDHDDRTATFRFLVRDRAGQFTDSFDAILAGAGINTVKIWRASQIPDTGPNKVRPGTEDDLCENGVESSRLSSRTRP
jgi:hypothetical protein